MNSRKTRKSPGNSFHEERKHAPELTYLGRSSLFPRIRHSACGKTVNRSRRTSDRMRMKQYLKVAGKDAAVSRLQLLHHLVPAVRAGQKANGSIGSLQPNPLHKQGIALLA